MTSSSIQALNIVTGVILARGLGPEGRGELAAILLWTMLVASIGSVGVPEAVVYETASVRYDTQRALSAAGVAWFALSVFLVLIGALLLTVTLAGYSPSTRQSGYILLSIIPLYLAANLCTAALQGLGAFGAFNVARILVPVTTTACLVGVTVGGVLTVETAALAYIATYLVTAAVSLWLLRQRVDWSLRIDRSTLRRMIGFGAKSQTSVVTLAMVQRLDQLLISVFLGATSLGLYTVAVTVTSATTIAASTVALVAFPRLASLSTQTTQRVLASRRFMFLAAGASTLITIPIVALTPQLLNLFFGASFTEVASVCRVLLVANIFLAFSQLMVALLKGVGRPLDAGVAGAVGLVVTIVLLVILLPILGLMGAAIASLVAYIVTAWWMLRKVCRALHVSIAQLVFSPKTTVAADLGRSI